jgi:nucleotide-binding universal stress UspA family protein
MMTHPTTEPVLCAFDASEPSILAAHTAAWLAEALGAPLELVFAVDPDDLPALPPHGAGFDPHVRDALPAIQEQVAEDAARAELEAALSALTHVEVTGHVLTGPAAAVIREYAVERAAVLLVTGTSARGGLQRLLQGSVSGTLAADSPCPVVVVPPGAALREPGPVMVGDDGSDRARRAVEHAQALADRLGREVVRVPATEQRAATLAGAAREQRACLIVAGLRDGGPLRRVFGSVTTSLIAAASRPVLLVSDHAVPQAAEAQPWDEIVKADARAAAWIGLQETHKRLTRELDAELEAAHGLTIDELELLSQLANDDAQRLPVEALEPRGLVARQPDGAYRITPAGLERLHAALRTHFAGVERAFFEHLSEDEIETLARVFGRLRGG